MLNSILFPLFIGDIPIYLIFTWMFGPSSCWNPNVSWNPLIFTRPSPSLRAPPASPPALSTSAAAPALSPWPSPRRPRPCAWRCAARPCAAGWARCRWHEAWDHHVLGRGRNSRKFGKMGWLIFTGWIPHHNILIIIITTIIVVIIIIITNVIIYVNIVGISMCFFFGKNASRSCFLSFSWVYLWGCPIGLLYWYWVNPTEVKTWNIQTIFNIWFGFRGITLYITGIWDAARKDVKVKQRPAVEKKNKETMNINLIQCCAMFALSKFRVFLQCFQWTNAGLMVVISGNFTWHLWGLPTRIGMFCGIVFQLPKTIPTVPTVTEGLLQIKQQWYCRNTGLL